MTEEPVCLFTIVSKNYLHYAINLMTSVAEHMHQARQVVVLCDRSDGLESEEFPFELIQVEDLDIPDLDRMLMQYTILELNTAIKPYVFGHLFANTNAEKIIYFDPDIQLFSSGDPLLETLDNSNIVLTPHLGDFLDDDRHPSEVEILQSGTYNLGFLALARSASSDSLVAWWQKKLLRQCIVDIPNGLFTDQKWMDLVPGIFADSCIKRDPGWNVAYWNLKHRVVEESARGFLVNGSPLFFFHFSGLELNANSISKHQDRFTLSDLSPACRKLFSIYSGAVDDAGRSRFASLPYAFATLPSGIPVPDPARRFLREHLDWNTALPDLRSEAGERLILDLLNKPMDNSRPVITNLAGSLYRSRPDLTKAFPDIEGSHRHAFVDWFLSNAKRQEGIDPVFVAPMEPEAGGKSGSLAAAGANTPGSHAATSGMYGVLYRIAWSVRFLFRPLLSEKLRYRLRMLLLRKAYHSTVAAQNPGTGHKAAAKGVGKGINVIGYLRAESGVGESARSMLRALNAAGVPHAAVNYDVGNISRQGEVFDENLPTGLHHDINLFHINADQIALARDFLGEDFFKQRYRIGYWAWELPEFPSDWMDSFSDLDEVWVPSTFCQQAIANKSPVPVVCIPHTIVIPDTIRPDRPRFGLRPDTTCFLAMGDMLSVPERKNPMGAVEAFLRAFTGVDKVQLVVKLSNCEARPEITDRFHDYARQHSNIHFIESYMARDDIFALLDTIDCFVSLHRSEGFGLVIAEAMARGKVVLATGWSGNMDFMNTGNSMIVDYNLVELDRDYGPYRQGQIWAEPDLDDAAGKMLAVHENPSGNKLLGERARSNCAELLSGERVGKLVTSRLEAINRQPMTRQ
ncbi:MAG: glycosyltransferase [Pseudohongiellaceae bacterium]